MDATRKRDGIPFTESTKFPEPTRQSQQNPTTTEVATFVETTNPNKFGMSVGTSCNTRNSQERDQSTSNEATTARSGLPDLAAHNADQSESNHTATWCDPTSAGVEPSSYVTAATMVGIARSRSNMSPSPLFPMESRVPFVDILETVIIDGVVSFVQRDGRYIFQTFVNPNYRQLERNQQKHRRKTTASFHHPPKQYDDVTGEMVWSDTSSSDKGNVNGQSTDETAGEARRRSGRKRKQRVPFLGDKLYGSKVDDIEFPNSLEQFCAIVELPDDLGPGDLLLVAWPETSVNRATNGLFVPQIFWIEIPETVPSPRLNSKRLLKVMAPGCDATKGKKRRLGGRGGRYTATGTPPKNPRSPAFQSPQKAEWFSYQKSASRVGRNYQVPGLPVITTPMDELVEPEVEGYGVLWDNELAAAAERNGQDLEAFLNRTRGNRMMMLEILHRNNYVVDQASVEFTRMYEGGLPHDASPFTTAEADAFSAYIMNDFGITIQGCVCLSKRFNKIAQLLGRSTDACLRHYYTKFKKGPMYRDLKRKIAEEKEILLKDSDSKEPDFCAICDDGGILISCDKCFRDFHQSCLSPPLVEVPEGDWFCPDCSLVNYSGVDDTYSSALL